MISEGEVVDAVCVMTSIVLGILKGLGIGRFLPVTNTSDQDRQATKVDGDLWCAPQVNLSNNRCAELLLVLICGLVWIGTSEVDMTKV